MSKRIHLLAQSRFGMPATDVLLEDEDAEKAIKAGVGELAKSQTVYDHEDAMPVDVLARSREELAVAEAAGDARQQAVRAAATAALKGAKK